MDDAHANAYGEDEGLVQIIGEDGATITAATKPRLAQDVKGIPPHYIDGAPSPFTQRGRANWYQTRLNYKRNRNRTIAIGDIYIYKYVYIFIHDHIDNINIYTYK